jgi:hypothetical protein
MNNCWQVVPSERINFKTILSELCAMKTNTEVNRKGAIFVARKDSWRFAIDDQLIQLKVKLIRLFVFFKSTALKVRPSEEGGQNSAVHIAILAHIL